MSNGHRTAIMRSSRTILVIFVVMSTFITARAQTYADLFNFDGTHGAFPQDPGLLAQGRDGNLYGTTPFGGTNNQGVVFKITPSGTLDVLYSFDGAHGSYPYSGLTLGRDGNFYGTTYEGGGSGCAPDGCGTVFKITQGGNLTSLYSFTNGGDGCCPVGPPIQGIDGKFYGATDDGTTTATAYNITSSGVFTP